MRGGEKERRKRWSMDCSQADEARCSFSLKASSSLSFSLPLKMKKNATKPATALSASPSRTLPPSPTSS